MKYLAGLMLLVLAHVANAIECRINERYWTNVAVYDLWVYVDVVYNANINKIWLENYRMDCRHNSAYDSNPVLTVLPAINDGVILYKGRKGGLRVGNTNYPIPVSHGVVLAVVRKEEERSVEGRIYIDIPTASGSYISIRENEVLGKINFHLFFKNDYGSKTVSASLEVRAKNDLNLSPSTCTINNNPIEVDFGSVDPLAVGGDTPTGTPYKKSVALNYSCPDAGIFSPMDIRLVGTASLFDSRALATDNRNLATAMTRNNSLVAPGSSFRTSISNSSGSDTVMFTLFRNAGSLPAAGPFKASGTLVMSVP